MSEQIVNPGVDPTRKTTEAVPFGHELQLMQSVARGEQEALEQLVALHGKALATFIGRMMAWHDDCNDIFQDVLVVAWQRADRYRGQGPLVAWLKRIAINRCKNHFRTLNVFQRKLRQFADRLLADPKLNSTFDVFGRDDCSIQDERLETAIQQLSPSDRHAVVLFYLEGYSGSEVARELGIKADTLHVRLHRIKKKLKQFIEAHE